MKKPYEYCQRQNHEYLGHFAKAKNLNRGHNDCEMADDKEACRAENEYNRAEAAAKAAEKEKRYAGQSKLGKQFSRAFDKAAGN